MLMLIVDATDLDGRRQWRGTDVAISGARRTALAKTAYVHLKNLATSFSNFPNITADKLWES
jgi:hypothetical protein